MAVTIQQIAEAAGVSRGTVDRAINHRGRISPEVAERIEQIAAELGYVPKHPKNSTEPVEAAGRKRIGVITQLAKASFMLSVDRGLRDETRKLERQGIEIVRRDSDSVDSEEQLAAIDSLDALGIDALAIMPVDCDEVRARLNRLSQERGIPIVTFNSDIVGTERMCFVGLDNRKSGAAAAGLLGMMMRGRGKILGIVGSFSNNASSRRIDGFAEELKRSFPGIELIGVQSSMDKTEEVERIIVSTMTAYPDLEGICVISGGQKGVAAAYEQLQLGKNRPFTLLYDLTPKNEKLLADGTVDFLIDQEGYMQGYRALSILADKLRWDRNPENELMHTEIRIKTKYNL